MPDKNAAAQRVIANALLLREMGFAVAFIGPTKNRENIVAVTNGFKCEYVDYPQNIYSWIKYILSFISKKRILDHNPNYIVLYNFPAIASLKILRICHKHGIKVFHDVTEWECPCGWSIRSIIQRIDILLRMRYCTKKMDGVIAISRYLYNYYENYTNTILIPPMVDLDDLKFNRERKLTASECTTNLVYAGSLGKAATKDRLDLIIEEINKFPNIRLDIVGQTKEQFYTIFGYDIEINENIYFHGRVSHNEAVQFVCKADFQILIREDTLKNRAGFPTKFVESFSCCIPLIATASSNICDYLKDGENGLLVTEEHPLEEVLKMVASMSAEEKIKMKKACRGFKGFDYRCYKDQFSKLFK